MSQDELSGPDLVGVVADAEAVGLPHVVIGGFSVIAHGYVRATKDSDFIVILGENSAAVVGLTSPESRRAAAAAKVWRSGTEKARMRFSRALALAFGILAPIGETVRRWDTWREFPPALFDDYVMGPY